MVTLKNKLTFFEICKIVESNDKVRLDEVAVKKIKRVRKLIENSIANKEIIYGVTTGFGAFKNTVISEQDVSTLQENLILSHAVGVGNLLPEKSVRTIMLLIANYLSKGFSGVRVELVNTLLQMIDKGVIPCVPEKGSVGSSGDLAPSAHIGLVLLGKGEAHYRGKTYSGKVAMSKAGIRILSLEAKEGLALTNNTSTQTAIASWALFEAKKLLAFADIVGALSVEALRGTTKAYDKRVHDLKPHPGQKAVAEKMVKLLKGSSMVDNSKTQDQYSLRCIPQIHGAAGDAYSYAASIINIEINSVTDNPLIFENEKGEIEVISGGNFHGEPVAFAMDMLGIALSEIGNISDRRIASILDPATNNGLPAFLIAKGGVNSGLMILQYTTAALVSENKILAHPASVDSIPTSANIEDLVSMGTIAARKAYEIVSNVKKALAIEAIVACQAINFRLNEGYKPSKETYSIYKLIRRRVPYFSKDDVYYPYIQKVVELIDSLEQYGN